MAKTSRRVNPKPRQTPAAKSGSRVAASKPSQSARGAVEPARGGWATDLVFDVREPKLAVSLRLDADVLRFFRGFGAGYQTRINEVLKAFMQARGEVESAGHAAIRTRSARPSTGNGKRAAR